MGHSPVVYSNYDLKLPEFDWRVSVSVDMFNFADYTPFKVFLQSEPAVICDTEAKLLRNYEFYDLILTWNDNVLSACKNARFFNYNASIWTQEEDTSQKKFGVSFLTSSKTQCWGHTYRQDIFRELTNFSKRNGTGDIPVELHKSPPYLPDKRGLLVPFQFSVAMENCQRHNFFTEKVLDCFATKTIPIYWGAPNIGEFFNMDGILICPGWDGDDRSRELHEVLGALTPEFYIAKQAAVEDNYRRVQEYKDRTGRLANAIKAGLQ